MKTFETKAAAARVVAERTGIVVETDWYAHGPGADGPGTGLVIGAKGIDQLADMMEKYGYIKEVLGGQWAMIEPRVQFYVDYPAELPFSK